MDNMDNYNQMERDQEENDMCRSNMMLLNSLRKSAAISRPATAQKKVLVRVPVTNPSTIQRFVTQAQPSSILRNNSATSYSSATITRPPRPYATNSSTATSTQSTLQPNNNSDFVVSNLNTAFEEDFSPQRSPALCSSRIIDEQEDTFAEQPSFHGLLIENVRNYQCLWLISSISFKDKNMRQRAWMEISVALGEEVDYLKKEWEKLKDNYRKCIQRRDRMTKSGSGSTKLPVCNFFKELSFLKDISSNRKGTSNVPNSTLNQTNTEDTTTVPSSSIPTKRNDKRKHSSDIELGIDAMLVKALSSGDKSHKDESVERNITDEDELFCLSLVGMLKSLPNKKKRYARMKIEGIFYELSEES